MRLFLTAALALAASLNASAVNAAERAEIPEKYKWNLADLYPSEAAWSEALSAAAKKVDGLAAHRGHLGDSPQALLAGLDAVFALQNELSRLEVYASCLSSEDTRTPRPREMHQSAGRVSVDLESAIAWVRPELLGLDAARIKDFQAKEPKLAPYRMYLDDVLRWKAHTLTAPEERVVAMTGEMATAGDWTYDILTNAELPYPTIKLSTGEEVRLDAAAYTLHRAARSREDRLKVFDAFFRTHKAFERTLGTTLASKVKAEVFDQRVHRFGSTLEAALFRDNIPTGVYKQLIADVRKSLPTLHRYLALRKKMLGLPELKYQDLYVPLVESVELRYEPEQARAVTLEALAPLGKDYLDTLKKGFESRWTDFLPSTGKRSGAYSTGVYGVHPYQLLNFMGRYEDLSVLAHESGHSMHTFLASSAQPLPTSEYSIFVAEVASTLNQNLLVHHLLAKTPDDATRLFLLGTHLDSLRTTLFRQTQFAEFELAFLEKAEKGEALTGENLSALYLKIVREYYGHDQGVCQVDELLGTEWTYIPHFYAGYYVYQYATSLVASTSLARGILEEAKVKKSARRDAYLRMLKAGGSKYPVELLKDAGVDMLTSAPFAAAMAEMNATMDEIEKILAAQKKAPAKK
ncbi:MAG: oligoendopeptidase F [Myxococcales bacterium]